MSAESQELLASGGLPELDRFIRAARDDSLAVSGEDQALHGPAMLLQHHRLTLFLQVPEAQSPIGAAGGQELAVWRECHRSHLVLVASEGPLFLAGGCVPQPHRAVRAGRANRLSIG